MILCATTLAVLLVIGGVEENPGPAVEAEKIMRVLCSGCERILKSGTQCDKCGRWFHNSCGNVKAQVAESGEWVCDKCRSERLRLLKERLQDALHQIDTLRKKNKALEEHLLLAAAGTEVGRSDTVPGHPKGGECLVLGDSIIRNVGTEYPDMKVECFPGIRTEQLQRIIERRELGSPDSVVIHVGTNDLRRNGNLDYIIGDVYGLVNTAKTVFNIQGGLGRSAAEGRRVMAAHWSS
jgi:hypothetical protein